LEEERRKSRKFRSIKAGFSKKPVKIFVGDSETWKHANKPAFWVFQDLYSDEEKIFYSKDKVRIFIHGFKGVIYFHNLDFDLATFLNVDEMCVGKKIAAGNKVIRFQFGACELRDSLALLVVGVSSLGESLGFEKGETPQKFIDGDSSKGLNENDIEYCRRDVEIVKIALLNTMKFYRESCGLDEKIPLENIRMPLTAASLSYRVFSESFWPFAYECIFINSEIYESTLKSYYGGRVQVFCESEKIHEDIYVYDINSLYPSEMLENKFPHPKKAFKINPNINMLFHHIKVGDCVWGKFKLSYEGDNPNALFLPAFNDKELRDYTLNKFNGYLCQPELEHALKLGWKIDEISEAYAASPLSPFDDFVKYFYNLRLTYQEQKSPLEFQTKIILNSLYGKFGQKDRIKRIEDPKEIEEIQLNPDWQETYTIKYYDKTHWYLEGKEYSLISKNTWAGWAAFITSYARVKLQKAIEICDTLYVDTDSIHTTTSPDEINLKLGNELGEWKVEYCAPEAQYWEPKVYRFMLNGNNIMVKHKGANKSDGNLRKPQIARTFTKYRTALRQNIPLGQFRDVVKKSRRFCKDG